MGDEFPMNSCSDLPVSGDGGEIDQVRPWGNIGILTGWRNIMDGNHNKLKLTAANLFRSIRCFEGDPWALSLFHWCETAGSGCGTAPENRGSDEYTPQQDSLADTICLKISVL